MLHGVSKCVGNYGISTLSHLVDTDKGTIFYVKFCSFYTEINKGRKETSIFGVYSLYSQRTICGEMRKERDI